MNMLILLRGCQSTLLHVIIPLHSPSITKVVTQSGRLLSVFLSQSSTNNFEASCMFLVIIPFYLSIFGFPLSPAWLLFHPGNDGWISNPSGPQFFCDQIDGLVEKTRWLFVWLRQRLAGFGRWCRSIAWRISSREYAGDGGAAINELMREQPPRILVLSLKTRINSRESTPT